MTAITNASPSTARRNAFFALALLLPAPTISVCVSLFAAPGPVGQAIFVLAKIWILALPVLWTLKIDREQIHLSKPTSAGLLPATALGALSVAAILAGYFLFAQNWIDGSLVRDLAQRNGIATPAAFFAAAAFWCVINSLLEEYVWRWFAYRKCATLFPQQGGRIAVVLSSLFFTLHHILALAAQFDWRITILASIGVFIGGVMWASLYRKYNSIWPGYLCHVLADLPIFLIGWWLISAR